MASSSPSWMLDELKRDGDPFVLLLFRNVLLRVSLWLSLLLNTLPDKSWGAILIFFFFFLCGIFFQFSHWDLAVRTERNASLPSSALQLHAWLGPGYHYQAAEGRGTDEHCLYCFSGPGKPGQSLDLATRPWLMCEESTKAMKNLLLYSRT